MNTLFVLLVLLFPVKWRQFHGTASNILCTIHISCPHLVSIEPHYYFMVAFIIKNQSHLVSPNFSSFTSLDVYYLPFFNQCHCTWVFILSFPFHSIPFRLQPASAASCQRVCPRPLKCRARPLSHTAQFSSSALMVLQSPAGLPPAPLSSAFVCSIFIPFRAMFV